MYRVTKNRDLNHKRMPRPTHRLTQCPQFSKNPETEHVTECTTDCDFNHVQGCKVRAPTDFRPIPRPPAAGVFGSEPPPLQITVQCDFKHPTRTARRSWCCHSELCLTPGTRSKDRTRTNPRSSHRRERAIPHTRCGPGTGHISRSASNYRAARRIRKNHGRPRQATVE